MATEKGLAQVVEEWRATALDSPHHPEFHEGHQYCADELQPFLERLKGLEQEWREPVFGIPPELTPDESKVACADQLHVLIHGEQPAQRGSHK